MSPEIDISQLNAEIHRNEKIQNIKNAMVDALEIVQELRGKFLEKDSPFWPFVLLQIFQEIKDPNFIALSAPNAIPGIAGIVTKDECENLPDLEQPFANYSNSKFLSLKEYLDNREKDHIKKALDLNDWNPQKTADVLGISRTTLWRKIKKHSIGREALRK